MNSPKVIFAHTSEAATPGASVAAQHGGGASAFDTPGPPSPGQASPARHRSQEDNPSVSRGRGSAGLESSVAAMATADAAAAEPLSKPRLRVQGADIILEDAASPKAPPAAAITKQLAAAAPAAAGRNLQPAANHHTLQQHEQQLPPPPPQQHHLVAAARASQSHEHELQLRLASRTATGNSNMAVAGTRQPSQQQPAGDDRLRHNGGDGAGPSGSGSAAVAAVEGPVRIKYRSTLTEENVAYLNKLDQYSSRPDSSERIWRWLDGSGPPFDNPPPSLGVPTMSKSSMSVAGKRQAGKRGFFSCFNCFSAQQ